MATFVLNLSTIRIVYARPIGRRLGSVDSTNRVRKLRLELTIMHLQKIGTG
ncbi:hypothetical protein PF005_g10393 [Phytophthora fragariae]|uniref:Uncharacterized protein n=1 Tax=Phytophthora fragariae TaxID=53985 RepID=A0A6A3ZEN8_9STRA|nr:hypothetical protein PF003_g14539 [Phytophthora fragariae]KAE8938322.1 hypothetical protein PF009_g11790 [Phytophthora fragariae]KAE9002988.1 hypothetical protein PF011_g13081 [Phytophthora fragariae]KAE9113459.1 hypothetical protein PF010_g10063 [Phytophthora fragariae]KAE9114655.1 hypothetical protein PF007_g10296 [Phytophthora fragariae]